MGHYKERDIERVDNECMREAQLKVELAYLQPLLGDIFEREKPVCLSEIIREEYLASEDLETEIRL